MSTDLPVRILLLGPPAAGKSSTARMLREVHPGVTVRSIDDHIGPLVDRLGLSSPLPDDVIDSATTMLLTEPAPDGEVQVVELPHHDYLTLLANGILALEIFDLVVTMTAPLDTLLARNAERLDQVPAQYVARSWGATESLLAWLSNQNGYKDIIRFDMEIFTPAAAVAVLRDVLRAPHSEHLARLAVLPDPRRPYLGGHFIDSVEWSEDLARSLIATFEVTTALDVGCGIGMTVDLFEQLGVRCWGIEGNPEILGGPSQRKQRLLLCDFTKQWVEWPVPVDLVWCVEVLEHVPEQHVSNVVRTIAHCTGRIAFVTAAEPGQPGYHHVNCRPKQDWIRTFAKAGLMLWREGDRLLERLPDGGAFGANYLKTNGMFFTNGEYTS